MSRAALTAAALSLALSLPATVEAVSPHVNPGVVPTACTACHRGHGLSRSPMLASSQIELCLSCHGSATSLEEQVRRGHVVSGVRPPLLGNVLSQPFVHPLTEGAFSRHETGVITCTSCHSPHRSTFTGSSGTPTGQRYLSPRNPAQFEVQLCESCHGNAGATTRSLVDISRLLNPRNRSYHPVEAPAAGASPSVVPRLRGREINCTDCHGNSDPEGPRGPHGSAVRYILRWPYSTTDGAQESVSAY
ncbi:MAG: cytochrome c3 family protein, partial [Acidobacteria bacterium]|nr:cytochrome c3 family protein [Acidobacteriota bacterium]